MNRIERIEKLMHGPVKTVKETPDDQTFIIDHMDGNTPTIVEIPGPCRREDLLGIPYFEIKNQGWGGEWHDNIEGITIKDATDKVIFEAKGLMEA